MAIRPILFQLGSLVITPGAITALAEAGQRPETFLGRHASGDWGEVWRGDEHANEVALRENLRLLSAYRTTRGVTLWVVTEADRSSTCILLPSEY